MTKTTIARAAAGAFLAGLVLASGVAAQGRPEGRAPDSSPAGPQWFDGVGSTIGAGVRDATQAEAAAAGLPQSGGAVVTRVADASAASAAGVRVGDIVVEFDGERVRSARQLSRLVRESAPNRAVVMAVVRDKARRTLSVTPSGALADLPDVDAIRRRAERAARDLGRELSRFRFEDEGFGLGGAFGSRRRIGAELLPLPDQLAAYFGVEHGVLIASVADRSTAARAGVKAGDVLTAVNGQPVRDVSDVLGALERATRSDRQASELVFTVTRDRKELRLTASIPDSQPTPRRSRTI